MRELCRLADIPDGAARGFGPAPGGFTGLFAARRGEQAFVYVNACPHVGAALDWVADGFLTADESAIRCAVHGAVFGIADGVYTAGPCVGLGLEAAPAGVVGGMLTLAQDVGI